DPVGAARRDLAHPVGVYLDADLFHRDQDRRQRQFDLAVELFVAALADALEQRLAQAQRRGGVTDEPGGLLLGLRLRQQLDAVLRREIVELVRGAARFDQVRGDHRVVGGRDAKRL